jgi:hypothetical protein
VEDAAAEAAEVAELPAEAAGVVAATETNIIKRGPSHLLLLHMLLPDMSVHTKLVECNECTTSW